MISTNDARPGMALNLPEGLFTITDYQHVKPGKGKAFVRMKLKNVRTGPAPIFAAALTRLWSKPISVAVTVMITNGVPRAACARTTPANVPCRPRRE